MSSQDYKAQKLQETLLGVKNGHALLPVFQREYVWNKEDIEALFESIADGYPIGTFIFWNVNRNQINGIRGTLLEFIQESKRSRAASRRNKEMVVNKTFDSSRINPADADEEYSIVLDGQQRLTSLYIGLYGSISYLKAHGNENKHDDWTQEKLYVNLDYDHSDPDSKRFAFLSDSEKSKGNYYLLGKMLNPKYKNRPLALIDDLPTCSRDMQNEMVNLHNKLTEQQLVNAFIISKDCEFDQALDIFLRINSTGKKLTLEELALASITAFWTDGPKKIQDLTKEIDGRFSVKELFVLRLFFLIREEDPKINLGKLDSKCVQELEANWGKIENAFRELLAINDSSHYTDENIQGYNAFMPVLWYLYHGGKINDPDKLKEYRKYIVSSFCNGLFGGQSSDVLKKMIAKLKTIDCETTVFSIDLFSNIDFGINKKLLVDEDTIVNWLDRYKKDDKATYSVLCLLYPEYDAKVKFDKDHCHPSANFLNSVIKGIGLSPEKETKWIEKKDLIPNLQFLTPKENRGEGKKDQSLKDWIEEDPTIRKVKYFEYSSTAELEFSNFENFFDSRRKRIIEELKKIFGIDDSEGVSEKDSTDSKKQS